MNDLLVVTLLLLGGVACGGDDDVAADAAPHADAHPGADGPPLPGDARVIFLHHSTGGVIWGGGVSEWIDAYNAANGTSYVVTAIDFPHDPYPWQNYPYDYWHLWVENGGETVVDGQETLPMLAADHEVIVWKHCFPVSGIEADTGSPDIASQAKTIENYKLQYAALKSQMLAHPDRRFLVWTGAALTESSSNVEQGTRAREFFTWVKGEWDTPGDNIFIWDFFELETEGGLFLLDAYSADGGGDSHPSAAFAAQVAPYFGQRIVDVIEGAGDTGSLTGQ